VSTQSTGAGGVEYTLAFLGRRRFNELDDSLTYVSKPASVDDETRRGLAHVIKLGLARYVVRATGAERVTISFAAPDATSTAKVVRDPWNYWVFRTAVNGFGNGETSNRSRFIFSDFSANRITENWKTNLSFNVSYDESTYELSDGERFVNVQRNYGVEFLQVKSMGQHWSAGMTGGVGSSTYLNERRVLRFAPAIEYNFFSYKESTRRQLRLQYSVGPARYDYQDTTIFLKMRETVPVQSLAAAISARQPWGSVSINSEARNFIDDPSKRFMSVGGEVSIRIIKGLNFNVGGQVSSIHDQIYLAKEDLTDEQILVRQRQLATSYRYFANFGVSYTFGSILNNVVNPRFGSNGGCC
jgi:hypothetical protein